MEPIFIVLIFVVVSVVQWVIKQRAQNAEPGDPSQAPPLPQPRPRSSGESEEERMRRFMEALGIPAGSRPPSRVAPKPQQPPPIHLPPPIVRPRRPLVTRSVPPPLARRIDPVIARAREQARRVIVETIHPVPPATPPPPIVQAGPGSVTPAVSAELASSTSSIEFPRAAILRTLLSSKEEVRTAMLLREILGPPKAFQMRSGGWG